MLRRISRALFAALLTASASAAALAAVPGQRDAPEASLADIVARPVPLRSGIGVTHEEVTTSVPRAQQYYDQGLAYLHSFVWIEAARSFNEAVRLDARLAMAQLGLSYALGELGESAAARGAEPAGAGIWRGGHPARALPDRPAQPSARGRRPAGGCGGRRRLPRAARSRAAERPSDVELLLLVGHAQEAGHDAHGMNGGSGSLVYYERALKLAPEYFATHHYLAHAYENVGRAAQALPHAQRFAQLAPEVPHAHHMYAHVLRQVDRMRDAVVEFTKADELHAAYSTRERVPAALDWHNRHNLDLLGTAYQYLGQMSRADATLRRSFEMRSAGHLGQDQEVNKRAWPLFLLSRRRVDEALSAARTLQRHATPLVQALGHVLASRILIAGARRDEAAAEGNLALKQMRAIGAVGGTLVPDFELAQGEYLLRSGENDKGAAMLRAAAAKLRADRRPDAWTATLFQLEAVARLARELDQGALAGDMAEMMRLHDPHYAGTQYALALVAERRGNREAARTAFADAIRRWQDADPDLPELADARRRLAALGPAASPRR